MGHGFRLQLEANQRVHCHGQASWSSHSPRSRARGYWLWLRRPFLGARYRFSCVTFSLSLSLIYFFIFWLLLYNTRIWYICIYCLWILLLNSWFCFVWKRSKLGAQFGSKCVENGVILLLLYYTIMGQLQLV